MASSFNMDAFLVRHLPPAVAAALADTDQAVAFVNWPDQRAAVRAVGVPGGTMDVAGVKVNDRFWARRLVYRLPIAAFREPPLLTQLSTLRGLRQDVNPHRHFVRPTASDLAGYLWEAGAESLDVLPGHPGAAPAFRFEFTAPLRSATGTVTRVIWRAVPPPPDRRLSLPAVYTNRVTVRLGGEAPGAKGEAAKVVIDNAPHAALYCHNLARGARVRVVVNASIQSWRSQPQRSPAPWREPKQSEPPRSAAVLAVVLTPAKRRALPAAFRWVAGTCCLPADMERALEMRHCCLRLGLPESVTLQAFYALHTAGTRTLHALLTTPDAPGEDATTSAVRHWARQQTLSLADVMHASGAFAPEWGKLRLALATHASGATHRFDDVLQSADAAGLAPHWPAFQEFLSRHNLWAVAHEFAVLPLRAKKKRRGLKAADRKLAQASDGEHSGAKASKKQPGAEHSETQSSSGETRRLSASAAVPIAARREQLHSESDKPPPSPPDELMSAA